MSKLFNLENKNVLLTGASKGMGAMAGLVNHGSRFSESRSQEKAFVACNASSKEELQK